MVGGSSIIWDFPLVIADYDRDVPGIEPGPLGWYTRALTTGFQEVRLKSIARPSRNKTRRTATVLRTYVTKIIACKK
jgi:hypothetical protein